MSRSRELAQLLRDQAVSEPHLGQTHLLAQFKKFQDAESLRMQGHARATVTGGEKQGLNHGCCRAFSLLHGIMLRKNEKEWWSALLEAVKEWDGDSSSLDAIIDTKRDPEPDEVMIAAEDIDDEINKDVIHTGAGFPRQLSLRRVIKIVYRNVMFAQHGRYQYIPGNESDKKRDYLFGPEISFREPDGSYTQLHNGSYYAVGNFNVERLMSLLQHPSFKAALKSSICLVYSSVHACHLYINSAGSIFFFDPNFMGGKAHPFHKKQWGEYEHQIRVFNRLDRSLGEGADKIKVDEPIGHRSIDLGFEMVTTEKLKMHPFQAYLDGLKENPFEYLAFKNMPDENKPVNFAGEFLMCEKSFRVALVQDMNQYVNSLTPQEKEVWSKTHARSLQCLMEAAVRLRDKEWLRQLLICVIKPSIIKLSSVKAILDGFRMSQTERSSYEAIFSQHRVMLDKQSRLTMCQESMFASTSAKAKVGTRPVAKKPKAIQVKDVTNETKPSLTHH